MPRPAIAQPCLCLLLLLALALAVCACATPAPPAPNKPEVAANPVGLEAALVCQRAAGEAFAEVECTEGLRRGDRFQVQFEVSEAAFVYIYLFNETGQFQMFFPSVGDNNRAGAAGRHTFPYDGGWFVADGPDGIVEHVRIVASAEPVAMLESLRGLMVPPRGEGVAEDGRGRIEPLVIRDWRPKMDRDTLSVTGSGLLAEVVEFRIPYL